MADSAGRTRRDALYEEAALTFGPALQRLARGYEADADLRRDLLQEIHIALWRSFDRFDGRCSLRTWVYRVAHNKAISFSLRPRTTAPLLFSLNDIEPVQKTADPARALDEQRIRERLLPIIRSLKPIDREVIMLYLEGLDAAAIGEITGLSAGNVATRVHRSKQQLVRRFHEGTR